MLKIDQINIGYSSNNALLDEKFSFLSRDPMLIALVGQNGSGKTTLLKTLAGLIPPLSGSVKISGKDIHNINNHHRSSLIAMVFSFLPVNLNLTVKEIFYLTSKLTHGNINNNIIRKTVHLLDLSNFFYRNFNSLSDGQKQKVMIARAIIQDTPILLLDEPFSHLDYTNKDLILNSFKLLKKDKLIIFTTHDELSVFDADLVWHIKNKKITSEKTQLFLAKSQQLRQIYNFYNANIVNNGKQE